jgi:hypothetical protein
VRVYSGKVALIIAIMAFQAPFKVRMRCGWSFGIIRMVAFKTLFVLSYRFVHIGILPDGWSMKTKIVTVGTACYK